MEDKEEQVSRSQGQRGARTWAEVRGHEVVPAAVTIVTGKRMWRSQRATALVCDLPAGEPDESAAQCAEPAVQVFSARGEERNF